VSTFRTIAWLFGVIYASIPPYWLVVHPFADRWRARGAKLKHVGPLWFVMWLILGAASWPFRPNALYSSWLAWIPAAALLATAYSIYFHGLRDFTSNQIVGRSELEPNKHEQRLNTSGIRARVRHPIYLAHLVHLTGWTIGSGLLVMYCLLAFTLVTGAVMIRYEERELVARFGQPYRDYQRRVPAVIPRF